MSVPLAAVQAAQPAPMAAPPIPAPAPPPQPTGLELETRARARLRHMIGLHLSVTAPSWNEILFSSKKIPISITAPPPEVLARVERAPTPPDPSAPPDAVDAEGRQLLSALAAAKPQRIAPRSLAGGPDMPPPADAVTRWRRRFFLVTVGPDALRLLVAAGFLAPSDVDMLEILYPEGLDAERQQAVQSTLTLATASARARMPHDLPAWLNQQLLTLTDDRHPSDFFKPAFAADSQPAKGPSASAGAPSKIAQQAAPDVSPNDRSP